MKTKTQHTPGPLAIEDDGHLAHEGAYWILDKDGNVVAELTGPNAERDSELFAAAPDLLEVAKELRGFVDCNCGASCDRTCTASKLRAAIAKAEGR